eukprot:TRINITY_DN20037_c0_g1_i2.p1 TRINITY_DN20037_c0_g1~~TRINITY_DN20037_c0_g1_i2.p1  ORF type:complete len:176 (-),score=28.08 TRINITY_DN20037_c0_g1_i2:268-795(-)
MIFPISDQLPDEQVKGRARMFMALVLGFQAFVCVLRLWELRQLLGGFASAVIVVVGYAGYRQDMQHFYIWAWGLGCAFLGLFELATSMVAGLLSLVTLRLGRMVLLALPPLADFVGVCLAWQLFKIYEAKSETFQFLVKHAASAHGAGDLAPLLPILAAGDKKNAGKHSREYLSA